MVSQALKEVTNLVGEFPDSTSHRSNPKIEHCRNEQHYGNAAAIRQWTDHIYLQMQANLFIPL